jgi:hypothetical protein
MHVTFDLILVGSWGGGDTNGLTFNLRHATQAVILRVMSGGFRSPKASLKLNADGAAFAPSAIAI